MTEELTNITTETIDNTNADIPANTDTDKTSKDGKNGKNGKSGTSQRPATTQFKLTIPAEDDILQEIFSRVKGQGQRNEFVKEAIYYYDYILHRAPAISSRHIKLRSDFNLVEDEVIYLIPSKSPDIEFPGEKMKLTINVYVDDEDLLDILSRVTVIQDFAKDAIECWDFILHNSGFHSRYLKLKPDNSKSFNNYGTKSLERNIVSTYFIDNQQKCNESTSKDNSLSTEEGLRTGNQPSNEGTQSGPSRTVNQPSNEVAQSGPSRTVNQPSGETPKGPSRRTAGPNYTALNGI